jgi:hypothetical protein
LNFSFGGVAYSLEIWWKFLEYVISLSSQKGFEREKRSRDGLVVAGFSVRLQK